MNLRKVSVFLLAAFFSASGICQAPANDSSQYPYWIDMMQDDNSNFFQTQRAFELYWQNRERDKADGWKVFKRWEYFMSQRVDANGNRPKPDQVLKEWQKYHSMTAKSAIGSKDHWSLVGPIQKPVNGGTGQPNGMGRINAIAIHPSNNNIIYVGTPSGGLWKTTNHGSTWTGLTDTIPTLGVSAIVINYSNPNTIYIGTGDRDAGDAPGLGVWISTDNGISWSPRNNGMGNRVVGRLIMNPLDSMTLLAATGGGIFKSSDGGLFWKRTSSNVITYKDIVYKPGDTSVVYATATGDFYRSADGGETWVKITSGLPGSNRLVIGVSPANSSYVYAVLTNQSTFKGLYLSTNSGTSFSLMSSTPNIMDYSSNGSGTSGQAWYDLCVAVDRQNANIIYVGGVNIFKSTNSGVTWAINAHWTGGGGAPEIHADQHDLLISPHTNGLYSGNDGGFYFTNNGGGTWTDLSSGLPISQIYKIGQSPQSANLVINGYQDNGTAIFDGNWRTELGADGMECLIDPVDSNYMYAEYYYGSIRRSSNYGQNFTSIYSSIAESGNWVTPFILLEGNTSVMITGFNNIWRTNNVKAASVTFTKLSNSLSGSNISDIRVLENSAVNNNILYFSREDSRLFRSDDIKNTTPTYTDLSPNLPTVAWPLDIEADPFNANKLYIVQSNKVYVSSDKGLNWTNISGTLPNVNMNTIVCDSSSAGDLYVGSEIGVFFRGAWMSDWIPFEGGLPSAVEVTELEIYHDADRKKSRIKAATYGRGLWSSPLYGKPKAVFSADDVQACIGQEVHFNDESEGYYHSMQWTFTGGNPALSDDANPAVVYNSTGNFNVKLRIWNDYEFDEMTKSAYISIDSMPVITITPPSATINFGQSVTLTASGGVTYTWSPIGGLDKFKGPVVVASPLVPTTYTVVGTNTFCITNGGQAKVTILVNPLSAEELNFDKGIASLFPNPASSEFTLHFSGIEVGVKSLSITDEKGQVIRETSIMIEGEMHSVPVDISSLADGQYIVRLNGSSDAVIFRLIILH